MRTFFQVFALVTISGLVIYVVADFTHVVRVASPAITTSSWLIQKRIVPTTSATEMVRVRWGRCFMTRPISDQLDQVIADPA